MTILQLNGRNSYFHGNGIVISKKKIYQTKNLNRNRNIITFYHTKNGLIYSLRPTEIGHISIFGSPVEIVHIHLWKPFSSSFSFINYTLKLVPILNDLHLWDGGSSIFNYCCVILWHLLCKLELSIFPFCINVNNFFSNFQNFSSFLI